jgi:hypothetical protein
MFNPQQKRALAAAILAKGKALAPDRFPQPSPDSTKAWADALGSTFDSLPFTDLWEEAVLLWSTDLAGDRMVTPREIRHAALVIRDRWETRPARREILRARREAAVEERDRQLAAGTFASIRGYGAPSALPERRNLDADEIGGVL